MTPWLEAHPLYIAVYFVLVVLIAFALWLYDHRRTRPLRTVFPWARKQRELRVEALAKGFEETERIKAERSKKQ